MKKIYLFLLVFLALTICVSAQNVGIGTTTPAYKLDVSGTVHSTGTLTVDAGANVAGDLTTHGGGVLYNTVSPANNNLKVYYRTIAFQVTNLAAHTVSAEGEVTIGGGFTAPPMIFTGDIVSNAGAPGSATPGPLYQLQLVTYGSATGNFKIRILNNSNSTISQTITWNVMCIGQ